MDVLDRLARALAEAVAREYGDPTTAAFSVADTYQTLVPYRAVRNALGLMELAAYEHALLRLLSGEKGYVYIEDPRVREELERELSSPNPILGVYRDYSAAELRLNPGPRPAREEPRAQRPLSDHSAPEPSPPAGPPESPSAPPAPPPRTQSLPERGRTPPAPRACGSCGNRLPNGRDVRFCPSCGAGQQAMPCRVCGAPLEVGWRYCVLCGHARGGSGR